MPRLARSLIAPAAAFLATTLLCAVVAPAAAAVRGRADHAVRPAASWRRPVDGAIVHRFAYDARVAFAAGQRRGIDLRAARGTLVRAPCSGRVTHAGPVPGRELGVTLRCGALVATLLGLRTTPLTRGMHVGAGAWAGTAAGPLLRLGARRAHDALGYVDPAPRLGPGGARGAPGLGPAPRDPPDEPPPPAAPRPPRRPPVRPRPPAPAAPAALPLAAYAGIAALAAATGGGALVTRRRRRRYRRHRRAARAPRRGRALG